MKYKILLTIACIGVTPANSQAKKHHWISFFAGPTYVTASPDLPDLWKGKSNVGASYGYGTSENGYWRLSLRFAQLLIDGKKFIESIPLDPDSYSLSGGSRSIFAINLDAIYAPTEDTIAFPLYAVAGAGYFSLGSTSIAITRPGFRLIGDKNSEAALLLNAGLGFRVRMFKKLYFYTECVYSFAATSHRSTSYIPFRIGLSAGL